MSDCNACENCHDCPAACDCDESIKECVNCGALRLTYAEREPYACDVCGNVPDCLGEISHGKGCYTQSEDGGGYSWVDLPVKYER